MNDLINARLVWDGGDDVWIPEEMGTPREDQMQGTAGERLCELAGRICYDSLGVGRNSADYHRHIREVNHGSVWEHFNFTVEMPFAETIIGDNRKMLVAWQCMNRPGVIILPCHSPCGVRITTNLRSVVEWRSWTRSFYGRDTDQFDLDCTLSHKLLQLASNIAPCIAIVPETTKALPVWDEVDAASVVEPISDHERWVSLYVSGSRGLSHELVRHGDFTAISQRSTRYVDESQSPWVEHPLIEAFKEAHWGKSKDKRWEPEPEAAARTAYQQTVHSLESWLNRKGGPDKLTARKQARGAARGYLGNALFTEMIFSASVSQWKHILRMRASDAADAEIRELAVKCWRELRRSQYGDRFDEFVVRTASDGIGEVLV